ncbi:MAG: ribonuclease E/G [Bacilli bacterium]
MTEVVAYWCSYKEIKYLVVCQEDRLIGIEWIDDWSLSVGDYIVGQTASVDETRDVFYASVGAKKNAFSNVTPRMKRQMPSMRKVYEMYGRTNPFSQGARILLTCLTPARGDKGARVTPFVEFKTPNVVYEPFGSGVTVSKKVTDSNKRRTLLDLGEELLTDIPGGLLFRTEAVEQCSEQLKTDVGEQLEVFRSMMRDIYTRPIGDVLKQERSLVEQFGIWRKSYKIDRFVTDVSEHFALLKHQMPIELKTTTPMGLFHSVGVMDKVKVATRRNVYLPSGGWVVVEETEAAVVIDVNMGAHRGSNSKEEAIRAVNEEAVHAICEEIKLRHLSGTIVVDFINMRTTDTRTVISNLFTAKLQQISGMLSVAGFTHYDLFLCARQRENCTLAQQLKTMVDERHSM